MSREISSQGENLLGLRIKAARKEAGLTQQVAAKRLAIAYQTINKYEKGHRTPDADLLRRMAKELNCNPDWLLTGDGPMKRLNKEDRDVMLGPDFHTIMQLPLLAELNLRDLVRTYEDSDQTKRKRIKYLVAKVFDEMDQRA